MTIDEMFRDLGAFWAEVIAPYGKDATVAFLGGFLGLPPIPVRPKLVIFQWRNGHMVNVDAITQTVDDAGLKFNIGYEDKNGNKVDAPSGAAAITISSDDAGAILDQAGLTADANGQITIMPAATPTGNGGGLGVATVTATDGTDTATLKDTVIAGKAAKLGFTLSDAPAPATA